MKLESSEVGAPGVMVSHTIHVNDLDTFLHSKPRTVVKQTKHSMDCSKKYEYHVCDCSWKLLFHQAMLVLLMQSPVLAFILLVMYLVSLICWQNIICSHLTLEPKR